MESRPASPSCPTPPSRPRPDSLVIVRSTLEIVALMKHLHPTFESALCEIEAEVHRAGQLLLDAGSVARARAALEALHHARQKLQQFDFAPERYTA